MSASPLIYGHRGACRFAPENTLAAIALAFMQGADGVEVDLRLSRDNTLLCFHDATLDRTTDGFGLFRSHSAEELRRLSAGAWFDPGFRSEPIPLLSELLELTLTHEKRMILELKVEHGDEMVMAEALIRGIRSFSRKDLLAVSSFSTETLREISRHSPGVVLHQLFEPDAWWDAATIQTEHPYAGAFDMPLDALDKLAGFPAPLVIWTVNEAEDFQKCRELGVAGVISDRPDLLIQRLP